MSATITPASTQLDLAQDIPSDSASYRLLDDVDIIDIMSTLGDLIGHPVTTNKSNNPTPIRTSLARTTFLPPLTPESVHSPGQGFLGELVVSPILTSPTFTPAANPFTNPAASPTIIAQQSAPTPRRDGYPRRRSTHRHPLSHSQLQPRAIIHRKASRPTFKRPQRRRSRTHWPVWYQEQRRRECKEAARNRELDKRRRLELMELWEEEGFQIVMNLLTEHLKREVLRQAMEIRRQLRRWEELEDYVSN